MAPARPLALGRMIREAIARVGGMPGVEIVLASGPDPILVTARADRLAELLDRVIGGALVAIRRHGQILIAVYPGDDLKSVRIELAHRVLLAPSSLQILEECSGTVRTEIDATIIYLPRSR